MLSFWPWLPVAAFELSKLNGPLPEIAVADVQLSFGGGTSWLSVNVPALPWPTAYVPISTMYCWPVVAEKFSRDCRPQKSSLHARATPLGQVLPEYTAMFESKLAWP